MRAAAVILLGLLLRTAPAHAQVEAEVDPDTERAQALFAEGAAAYQAHDYATALQRMQTAKRLRPLPALDYNIARCYDRMGDEAAALEAYETYRAAAPTGSEIVEVERRIGILRGRLGEAHSSRRRWIAPGVVGGLALVLLGTGAGLAGSAGARYDDLHAQWLATGSNADLSATASSLQHRETAGFALLGVGGAVAVVDLVLIGLAARQRARAR